MQLYELLKCVADGIYHEEELFVVVDNDVTHVYRRGVDGDDQLIYEDGGCDSWDVVALWQNLLPFSNVEKA